MRKILLWIDDSSFLQYCFSTILKNKTNYEFSAIADVNKKGKKFLDDQNLLDFTSISYYRECMPKKDHNPDEQFLENFEKKYGINLWTVILSERLFYNFTTYYKPSKKEILSIVESTCRFFEKALQNISPDFVFMKTTDNFHNTLFFELCKAMKIKVLTLASGKLANSTHVSLDNDAIDETKPDIPVTEIEIEQFLDEHDPYKQDKIKKQKETTPIKKRLINFIRYMKEKEDETYYPNFGRKSIKFILINFKLMYLGWQRKKFLEKNSIKTLEDEKIVYFPLHFEPERTLLITAPFYSNQIEVITNIAKSLPIEYKLYVKEHSSMELLFWHDKSFYNDIIKLQNVKLVHPSVNPKQIIKKCDLVTTIAGTVGLEALFFEKPVIVFSDVIFSYFPNVYRIKNKNDLPKIIRKVLTLKPNKDGIKRIVSLYKKECINIDRINLQHKCMKNIGMDGINNLIIPTQEKLKKFIDENKKELEIISDEHISKMELYEKNNVIQGHRNDVMIL
ncbi:MAG: hypothetical protein CXT78_05785 [Thaumarchaeota archaeon]|jgi:hypothetical protein|nr:MAG: hypothetical protein CXT78_05785 [Nitrososphaerota archaeon]